MPWLPGLLCLFFLLQSVWAYTSREIRWKPAQFYQHNERVRMKVDPFYIFFSYFTFYFDYMKLHNISKNALILHNKNLTNQFVYPNPIFSSFTREGLIGIDRRSYSHIYICIESKCTSESQTRFYLFKKRRNYSIPEVTENKHELIFLYRFEKFQ